MLPRKTRVARKAPGAQTVEQGRLHRTGQILVGLDRLVRLLRLAVGVAERVRALALLEPVIGSPWRHFMLRSAVMRWIALRKIPLAAGALKRRRRFASYEAAFEAYKGRGGFKTWPDAALKAYVDEGFKDAEDAEDGVVLRCDPAWEAAVFVAHGADVWGALHDAPGPIIIRAGASYSTFPPSSERRMRAIRQDVDFERVEGTTHFLPQERPDVARAALQKAMDRRAQSRPSG